MTISSTMDPGTLRFSEHDQPPPEWADIVDQGLGDANDAAAPLHEVQRLAVFVHDDGRAFVGDATIVGGSLQQRPAVIGGESRQRPAVIGGESQQRPAVIGGESQQRPAVIGGESQQRPAVIGGESQQRPAVIGGAVGRIWGGACELQQLWVHPSHRRQGLGAELVRRFEARAAARGARHFYLETWSFQAPRLYAALGYRVVHHDAHFPHGLVKYTMAHGLAADLAAPEAVVLDFWQRMASNHFDSLSAVLAEGFVLEWPQSRERIRGAERFVRMNAEYPVQGRWRFTLKSLVAGAERVVTEVVVEDDATSALALSFFSVAGGRITKLVEYWPEPYAARPERAHLVEPMD